MTSEAPSFDASPEAASLIEGLRDLGYSLDTALADIVDNSIAAKATEVRIDARFVNGSPVVSIADDGCGMDEATLRAAMRPGSSNPLSPRAAHDLGRFGLGLKTASFSQCRKLTVVTRSPAGTFAAQWDLDHVARSNEWRVLVPETSSIPQTSLLGESGTVVIWQNCDRLIGPASGPADSAAFNERVSKAEQHLALVFHRYLEGESDLKHLSISVNQRPLKGLNPFPPGLATPGPDERIPSGRAGVVRVTPFTLPHHSAVNPDTWERLSLGEGYVRSQGFYLYRRKRLIVHGTWFGLARQLDLSKLARVRIDVPPGVDDLWKINVLKASAHPPPAVRSRLSEIIKPLVEGSRRAYVHRGRRLDRVAPDLIWERQITHGAISYSINSKHMVFERLRALLRDTGTSELERVLSLIARTIPYDSLLVDFNENPKNIGAPQVSDEDLALLVTSYLLALRKEGFDRAASKRILRDTGAFATDWDRAEPLVEEFWTLAGGDLDV